ncbi:hypothetical protein [Catellicoccus marimammalium]|uniref:Uncharacterized protein n=1 Tax=Catellicoccus marimammalium M35/04/3 TaxID=1234409 RepID=K8ZA67_9ENTE|nr:hypothetical protein [Catellicoccus marimammalium]EKU26937.1 hypothetical protein C683_1212 [Catellicoccus marimammalium M35/04/3]
MIRYFKNKKRKKEEDKQTIISEIKKVHQKVQPLDPEVEKIFIKGIRNLEKGKNPEYIAYQIERELLHVASTRYDDTNNEYYHFPEPIEELMEKFAEIGAYFIRIERGGMM